jgi:hypothetical protein
VASSAGVFFHSTAPADFASAVKSLEAQDAWQMASQKCLERSKFFDWNESASKLVIAIESITR